MRVILFFRCLLFLCLIAAFPGLLRADDAKIQALKDAIRANPNDSTAHFNLGVSYLKETQYDLAAPEFETCVHLNSKDDQSRELMESCQGISAFLKQECSKAIEHFQNVLKVNPKNKDILIPLYQCQSKIAMDNKKYKAAEESLNNILALDPNNLEALTNLGFIHYQNKDLNEAVSYWERAVLIQKDARLFKYLGYSNYNLGHFKQAIDNYNQSIELELAKSPSAQDVNSLDETYYDLGEAYFDNSLYDDAEDAFDHAFIYNPKDANAAIMKAQSIDAATNYHMDKGNRSLLSNQYADAIREWQKVLLVSPENKDAKLFIEDANKKINTEVEKHYQAGLQYAQKKQTLKALDEWNAALEMDPENAKVKTAIANTKTKTSEQVGALTSEGNRLVLEKDYVGALEKYQKAQTMNPASATLRAKTGKVKAVQAAELKKLLALSQSELTKGNLKSALLNLENAYRVDPSNAEVKDGLFKTKREIRGKVDSLLAEGTSLFDAGDKLKSKQKFEAVLSLDPNNEKANEFIQKMTGQQAQEKIDADKVKSLYYEGVNNYINGNIHEAVQKWQECLKLDPSNVNAKENINKAMAKLQSIEQLSHN